MNKKRGLLAVVMALAMVFAGAVLVTGEANADEGTESGSEITYVAMIDGVGYESLVDAIKAVEETGGVVKLLNDLTINAEMNSGYGKAGVVITPGVTLDGDGHTLTVNGANGTWDCAVAAKGGTITNITISGAFRGIFMPGASGDVVIDKVVLKDVVYTFNSDAGSKDYSVTITNTELHGWTSFSDVHKLVTFTNCLFTEGNGNKFCRPYNYAVFTDCVFTHGFEVDTTKTEMTFVNCTMDGEDIFDTEMFYKIPAAKTLYEGADGVTGWTVYQGLEDALESAGEITLLKDIAASEDNWATYTIGDNTVLTVPAGTTVSATFKTDDGNQIKLTGVMAGTDGFTISKGSLVIGGDIVSNEGSTITIESGEEVFLSGTIEVPIVVEKDAKIIVKEGETLEAPSISGEGTVVNNGVVIAEMEESMVDASSTGESYPEGIVSEKVTISGVLESDVKGKANQIITITDDLVVKSGVTVTINGAFVVEEGAQVTFETGSTILFNDRSEATIDGDIVIEAGAAVPTFTFNGDAMDVNGSITLDGANAFACAGPVNIAGYFEISETASATFTEGATVLAGGELAIYGIAAGEIVNNGTITIDSEGILGDGSIAKTGSLGIQLGADATFDVINIFGTVTVTDSALQFKTGGKMVGAENDNTVSITDVAGLTVTETLVVKTVDGKRVGENTMTLSGSVAAADNADATVTGPAVTIAESDSVTVSEPFTIGKSVFTIDGGLLVTGDIDATADGASIVGKGGITVTGSITAKAEISGPSVDAAVYRTQSPAYFVYTTLEDALAAGATDITVTGDVGIASDITVPVGTKVDASKATGITVEDGATMTVEAEDKKSGTLKNGTVQIDVEGTLVVENLAKSGLTASKVVSDTSKASGDSMTYTNVYNALANAVEGDEVEITAASVVLDRDLTVPAGVALVVPKDSTLVAGNNITVTVDGELDAVDGAYTIAAKAEDTDKKAVTTVNGTLVYGTADYSSDIVGAYFVLDGENTIAPLATAAGAVNDIESDILLNGKMTVRDIAFDYTGDVPMSLVVRNDLAAGTVTIGALVFDASEAVTVKATIALANGTVELDNVTGITVSDVVTYDADNNEILTATISGTAVKAYDADATDAVPGKGSVGVTGAVSTVAVIGKDVTVNVPAGAELTVAAGSIATLFVDGTVGIDGTVGEIGTATVMGTLDGKAVTVGKLYAGIQKDDITATTAASAVIGDKVALATAGVAYVAPGTTLGKGISEASGVATTEFYVGDALFLTAYADAAATDLIEDVVIDVDDARFDGWLDKDGVAVDTTATVGSVDKVYADVEYEIFTISVNTVPGTVVYVDGVEYVADTMYAAGSHSIAVYLKAGYEGTPVIKVNGTEVTDSFTISGEETVITVSGVAAATGSGTIVIQPEGEDDGMALTDILLIILVVLIVIMAVIVALRMMRS